MDDALAAMERIARKSRQLVWLTALSLVLTLMMFATMLCLLERGLK